MVSRKEMTPQFQDSRWAMVIGLLQSSEGRFPGLKPSRYWVTVATPPPSGGLVEETLIMTALWKRSNAVVMEQPFDRAGHPSTAVARHPYPTKPPMNFGYLSLTCFLQSLSNYLPCIKFFVFPRYVILIRPSCFFSLWLLVLSLFWVLRSWSTLVSLLLPVRRPWLCVLQPLFHYDFLLYVTVYVEHRVNFISK